MVAQYKSTKTDQQQTEMNLGNRIWVIDRSFTVAGLSVWNMLPVLHRLMDNYY